MTDLAAQALATIPGRTELVAQLDRVHQATPAIEIQNAWRQPVVAQLVDEVIAVGSLPENVDDLITRASNAAQLRVRRWEVLREVEVTLRQRLERLGRDGADVALAFLHDKLAALMAEVREVDDVLRSVASAEAAIAAGPEASAAWSRLTDLLDQYNDLRDAQESVVRMALPGLTARDVTDRLALGGIMANYDETWADFLVVQQGARVAPPDTASPAPWPSDAPLEYLRWLTSGPPKPWVPSLADLEATWSRVRAAGGQRLAAVTRKWERYVGHAR